MDYSESEAECRLHCYLDDHPRVARICHEHLEHEEATCELCNMDDDED